MSRKLSIVLLVLLAITGVFYAQGRDVESFLDETDALITEHEGDFDGDDVPAEALRLYNAAVSTQETAWEHYDDGGERLALHFSQDARRLLHQAVRMLEHGSPAEGMAERFEAFLTATGELIDEIEAEFGDETPEECYELIEAAEGLLDEAWDAFDTEDYREAHALGTRARSLAIRARFLNGDHEIPDERLALAAEREIEMTSAMIERATPVIEESGDEDAAALLEEAIELLDEAEEYYEAGDYEMAIAKARQARTLLERAMRALHEDEFVGRVEAFLEETDAEIEEHAGEIEESGIEEAIEALEDAIALQDEAWESFDGEEYRLALSKSQQARRLLHRVMRLIED